MSNIVNQTNMQTTQVRGVSVVMPLDISRTDFNEIFLAEFIRDILPKLKKPLYQRAMYWLLTMDPKKPGIPNCRDFINFVKKHNAAIQRIHLAVNGNDLSLMDGNNRIHALLLFVKRPHKIFPEYFNDVFNFIDKAFPTGRDALTSENNNLLKEFFKCAEYKKIRYWSTPKNGFGTHIYNDIIKANLNRDEIDEFQEVIEELPWKWGPSKIDPTEPIDMLRETKLSFAQYHNYTVEQQVQTFEDTNRYDSTMSKRDAISANICFVDAPMNDDMKIELCKFAQQYLDNKGSETEAFIQLTNEKREEIRELKAFDWLVSLNDYCADKFGLFQGYIAFCESKKGGGNNKNVLPVTFDLFNSMYNNKFKDKNGDEINRHLFTKENINDFNLKFINACKLLRLTLIEMYPDKIEQELFGKTSYQKGKKFDKTKLLILFTLIIKEQNEGSQDADISKALKICLFWHILRKELPKDYDENILLRFYKLDHILNNDEKRGHLKSYIPKAQGKSLIEASQRITRAAFKELLNRINALNIIPTDHKGKNTRRKHNYFKKVMMTMWYVRRMPSQYLRENVKYEIDHMIPHSCHWNIGELDLCRLGNLIAVLKGLNQDRKNNDMSIYYGTKYRNFSSNLTPILYSNTEYERIVKYEKRGSNNVANIIHDCNSENVANQYYNQRCTDNEEHYINNFLDELY